MVPSDWYADLYRARYRPLVLMVLATAGGLAEAEEAVQDAFERGYARRARLEEMTNPEAWLYTVAINVLRRRHRRRLFSPRRPAFPADAPTLPPDSAAEVVDLYRALGQLPVTWREVLVLHHLADLAVVDIADRLGVPVGTVKSRLARGRDALADRLSATAEEVRRDG